MLPPPPPAQTLRGHPRSGALPLQAPSPTKPSPRTPARRRPAARCPAGPAPAPRPRRARAAPDRRRPWRRRRRYGNGAPPLPSAGGPSAAPWRRGGALCEAVVGRKEPLPPPSGAEERPQPAGRPGLRGHPRGTRGGDTRAPAATPRRHFQHTMMLGSFSSRSSSSL